MQPNPTERSATVDLQLAGAAPHGIDPTIEMASAPLVFWATAYHERWIPVAWLKDIAEAAAIQSREGLSWGDAGGPAST